MIGRGRLLRVVAMNLNHAPPLVFVGEFTARRIPRPGEVIQRWILGA